MSCTRKSEIYYFCKSLLLFGINFFPTQQTDNKKSMMWTSRKTMLCEVCCILLYYKYWCNYYVQALVALVPVIVDVSSCRNKTKNVYRYSVQIKVLCIGFFQKRTNRLKLCYDLLNNVHVGRYVETYSKVLPVPVVQVPVVLILSVQRSRFQGAKRTMSSVEVRLQVTDTCRMCK